MAGQDSLDDAAAAALNDVADAADATASEQREVAATSRQLSRERTPGSSWRAIADGGRLRTLLGLLGASARRLSAVGNSLRRAMAVALAREGLTTRQIGERFGVSHQRVSSLLRQGDDSSKPSSRVEGTNTLSGDGGTETRRPPEVES